MECKFEKTVRLIKNSKRAYVFTGAGVSVESGIPSFRGKKGIWSKYDPKLINLEFFYNYPEKSWLGIKEIFYNFIQEAKPNKAHEILFKMEEKSYFKGIITQNIDGLHQAAGSTEVCEYHGTSKELICTSCYNIYKLEDINMEETPVECPKCNGLMKPNFVFFGEGIPEKAYEHSLKAVNIADLILIVGTSGEVQPAGRLPFIAKANGAKIIEINMEPSNFTDIITDVYLEGSASEILEEIWKQIN